MLQTFFFVRIESYVLCIIRSCGSIQEASLYTHTRPYPVPRSVPIIDVIKCFEQNKFSGFQIFFFVLKSCTPKPGRTQCRGPYRIDIIKCFEETEFSGLQIIFFVLNRVHPNPAVPSAEVRTFGRGSLVPIIDVIKYFEKKKFSGFQINFIVLKSCTPKPGRNQCRGPYRIDVIKCFEEIKFSGLQANLIVLKPRNYGTYTDKGKLYIEAQ